ncbi:MAG TPA: hypothetical protein VKZ18_02030 [Polyangia bacterium]|nr:hypothetical protein [Polyangia bacterium]
MVGRRVGRALAVASLGLAAACGGSSPLPAVGDGSVARDATPRADAVAPSDATPPRPDAGPPDTGGRSDGGAPDGSEPADAGAACPVPLAPDLSIIAVNEVLKFVVTDGSPIEVAVLPASAPSSSAAFQQLTSLSLTGLSGPTRVLARTEATGCLQAPFNAVYDVRPTYAPAPPDPTTTAVAYDAPAIVGWATGVESYLPGPGVTEAQFMMTDQALGPAGTNTLAVLTLGNGGSVTLTFGAPITDGDGWDFAVYENSFASDVFLELGFVEVSSDGTHFARFDSAFQGTEAPGGNSSGTAAQIGGLAGSYMVGYGTPFDLAALRNAPLVRDGTVDLTAINYVRIVDIIGDGMTLDSFGRGIIDPLSNGPTAGFDLDGVAVLNQRK